MADAPGYRDSDDGTRAEPNGLSAPRTPRWVKVFAVIALVLVLLAAIALFTGLGGPHGPGRHMPAGDGAANEPDHHEAGMRGQITVG